MAVKRGEKKARKTGAGGSPYKIGPGEDAEKAIDAILEMRPAELKGIAEGVRQLVKKTLPKSREGVNPWGIPTFDSHGPVCFMMIGKYHVTFGFPRGASLADAAGLLEGTGKNLRHVKLKARAQLDEAGLRELLREAAAMNRETPLTPSMREKK